MVEHRSRIVRLIVPDSDIYKGYDTKPCDLSQGGFSMCFFLRIYRCISVPLYADSPSPISEI